MTGETQEIANVIVEPDEDLNVTKYVVTRIEGPGEKVMPTDLAKRTQELAHKYHMRGLGIRKE
jgi:hypothetical protein